MFSHPSKKAKASDPCFCASGKAAKHCCGPSLPTELASKDLASQAVLIDLIATPHASKGNAYINYLVWSAIEKAKDLYPLDTNNIKIITMTGCGSTNAYFSMIKINHNELSSFHEANKIRYETMEQSLEVLLVDVMERWLMKTGKPQVLLAVLLTFMKRIKEIAAERGELAPEMLQEVVMREARENGGISAQGGGKANGNGESCAGCDHAEP